MIGLGLDSDLSFLIVLVFLMNADTTAGDDTKVEQLLKSRSVTADPLRKVVT